MTIVPDLKPVKREVLPILSVDLPELYKKNKCIGKHGSFVLMEIHAGLILLYKCCGVNGPTVTRTCWVSQNNDTFLHFTLRCNMHMHGGAYFILLSAWSSTGPPRPFNMQQVFLHNEFLGEIRSTDIWWVQLLAHANTNVAFCFFLNMFNTFNILNLNT